MHAAMGPVFISGIRVTAMTANATAMRPGCMLNTLVARQAGFYAHSCCASVDAQQNDQKKQGCQKANPVEAG